MASSFSSSFAVLRDSVRGGPGGEAHSGVLGHESCQNLLAAAPEKDYAVFVPGGEQDSGVGTCYLKALDNDDYGSCRWKYPGAVVVRRTAVREATDEACLPPEKVKRCESVATAQLPWPELSYVDEARRWKDCYERCFDTAERSFLWRPDAVEKKCACLDWDKDPRTRCVDPEKDAGADGYELWIPAESSCGASDRKCYEPDELRRRPPPTGKCRYSETLDYGEASCDYEGPQTGLEPFVVARCSARQERGLFGGGSCGNPFLARADAEDALASGERCAVDRQCASKRCACRGPFHDADARCTDGRVGSPCCVEKDCKPGLRCPNNVCV